MDLQPLYWLPDESCLAKGDRRFACYQVIGQLRQCRRNADVDQCGSTPSNRVATALARATRCGEGSTTLVQLAPCVVPSTIDTDHAVVPPMPRLRRTATI